MDDSDGDLQALVAFRAAMAVGQASDNQALAAAHNVFAEDGPQRWELESLLLIGLPSDQIGERCGLPPNVIDLYEQVFFAVRTCLKAQVYLLIHVVGDGRDRGFQDNEVRNFWAYMALSGQPTILKLLIDTFHRLRCPGERPVLSIYLRPGADIARRLQACVASTILPPHGPAGKAWTEINLRQLEAEAAADPDRRAFLLEQVRNYHVRTARAVLAGKPLPKWMGKGGKVKPKATGQRPSGSAKPQQSPACDMMLTRAFLPK